MSCIMQLHWQVQNWSRRLRDSKPRMHISTIRGLRKEMISHYAGEDCRPRPNDERSIYGVRKPCSDEQDGV